MIRSKDLNAEIKILEDIAGGADSDEKALLKGLVKGIALVLKVMRDIKTNQVRHLQHLGIELIKPREGGRKDRTEKKSFEKKVIEE